MRRFLLLFALLLFSSPVFAEYALYPTTIQEINAVVAIKSSGTISGELNDTVKIKVLSLQENQGQTVSSLKQTLEINGKTIWANNETDGYGNMYAVFEVNETGEFAYKIEGTVRKRVEPKNMRDFDLNNGITEQGQYIKETKNIQSGSASIRTLALNRFPSSSWLETVAGITEWTHGYITYDSSYYPETYSAIETLKSRRGTCDEFATLSAAILRAKGIPARVVLGPVFSVEHWNFHGWLEAYNPNSGWIGIDSTYGEAGIVDATHIEMGRFPDFSDAADMVIAPTAVSVEIGQKSIDVNIINSKQFSNVISFEASNVEMRTNSWQDLNVVAENLLNSYLIAPIEIALPQDFTVDMGMKVVLLKPLEKRIISWRTIVVKELAKNQHLQGKYWLLSLRPPVEMGLRVLPESQLSNKAQIEVLDLFSFIEGDTLKIELSLENRGAAAGNAEILITSENKEVEKAIESVEAFTRKTIGISVENYSKKPYFISVGSENMSYNATIIPKESVEAPAAVGGNEKTAGENQRVVPAWAIDEEALILMVLVIAIIAILLLLKELVFK